MGPLGSVIPEILSILAALLGILTLRNSAKVFRKYSDSVKTLNDLSSLELTLSRLAEVKSRLSRDGVSEVEKDKKFLENFAKITGGALSVEMERLNSYELAIDKLSDSLERNRDIESDLLADLHKSHEEALKNLYVRTELLQKIRSDIAEIEVILQARSSGEQVDQ